MIDDSLVCYIRTTASNYVLIVQLYLNWFRHYSQFCVGASFDRICPVYGGRFCHLWVTFCQWWYSSCYHRMPARASLADRKNIQFIVVINCEENDSQIWSRRSNFLLSMYNGIFDGTLTAGAIGGEPYCEFSKPRCECTKALFKSPLILRAFRSYPLGDRTCPTRRRSQYFGTFYWKLVLFGNNVAQHDNLGSHDLSKIVVKVTIILSN